MSKPYIIVVGNEKGGAGKTTTTMHLVSYLMNLGFKVSSIDTDVRQRSLTSYIENRQNTRKNKKLEISIPNHFVAKESDAIDINAKNLRESEMFSDLIQRASYETDFIVIDTPGSNTNLSRIAHTKADTIITPINDSFVDLDVLAKVDPDSLKIIKPSHYSEFIWDKKIKKAKENEGELHWVVLRNRVSTTYAHNRKNMETVLSRLGNRVGFSFSKGFSERVIFKELFLQGLTLLDINKDVLNITFSLSHIAAKQELRDFIGFLNIKKINDRLSCGESIQEVQA